MVYVLKFQGRIQELLKGGVPLNFGFQWGGGVFILKMCHFYLFYAKYSDERGGGVRSPLDPPPSFYDIVIHVTRNLPTQFFFHRCPAILPKMLQKTTVNFYFMVSF